ncbi:LysE family translocator [Bradyrhizobium sp. 25ACV]
MELEASDSTNLRSSGMGAARSTKVIVAKPIVGMQNAKSYESRRSPWLCGTEADIGIIDMEHLPEVGLAFGAFALGMFSPGPNILSVIGTSMAVSRRAGVALATGISAGSFLWASMTAIGLTALIAAYASVLTVIKIVGGLYLLWLAYKAFCSAASAKPIPDPPQLAARSLIAFFLRGLIIQMTNPKAALTWIAIMSLGLSHSAPASTALTIVVGTTILSVIGHVAYALAFSTERVIILYRRARRGIDAALGVFFTIAGVKLLTSRT